jgi:hypothetical protein
VCTNAGRRAHRSGVEVSQWGETESLFPRSPLQPPFICASLRYFLAHSDTHLSQQLINMSDKNCTLAPAGPLGQEAPAEGSRPVMLEDLADDPLRIILCKVMGHDDPDEDFDLMFECESGLGAQRRELLGTLDQVRTRPSPSHSPTIPGCTHRAPQVSASPFFPTLTSYLPSPISSRQVCKRWRRILADLPLAAGCEANAPSPTILRPSLLQLTDFLTARRRQLRTLSLRLALCEPDPTFELMMCLERHLFDQRRADLRISLLTLDFTASSNSFPPLLTECLKPLLDKQSRVILATDPIRPDNDVLGLLPSEFLQQLSGAMLIIGTEPEVEQPRVAVPQSLPPDLRELRNLYPIGSRNVPEPFSPTGVAT